MLIQQTTIKAACGHDLAVFLGTNSRQRVAVYQTRLRVTRASSAKAKRSGGKESGE